MKLNRLSLFQFKGIDSFTADFGGQDATVYGMNGSGKSSLADGFLWLLTGKNNAGETFDPFPLDEAGNRKHDGQEPTVEAEFINDMGETFTLKRSLIEKRVKKTGYTESTYTGDESKCWIDGVPKKMTEYNAFVEREFTSDSMLRLLTCTGYFNQQIKKAEDRRALLFQVFGDMADAEILEAAPELAELAAAIGRKTVADFHLQKKAEHSETCKQLDLLPVRIDEAAKSLVDGIDVEAAKDAVSKIGVELAQLLYDVANYKGDPAATIQSDLIRERRSLEYEELQWKSFIGQKQDEHLRQYQRQERTAENDVIAYRGSVDDLQAKIQRGEKRIKELDGEIQAKRDEWTRKNAEVFTADETCPTCGQSFPETMLEEMRGNWNEQKSAKLGKINEDGKALAADKAECEAALGKLKVKMEQARERLDEAAKALQTVKDSYKPFAPSPEPLKEHEDKIAELRDKVAELEKQFAAADAGENPEKEQKKQRIAELENQQAEQRTLIAKAEASAEAQKRINQYEAEQIKLGEVRDETAKMIQLCEDFVRIKAEKITDNINRNFQIVRFKLFRDFKTSDGIKPDCITRIMNDKGNLVPYQNGGSNRALMFAADLDIVSTFGRKLGLNFPVFIDDSEGVFNRYGVTLGGAQEIRLIATETDKELRVEKA